MKKLLVTRPESDTTLFYLSKWCDKVLKIAEEKGIKLFDLNKQNANRKKLEQVLLSKKPKLIIFNGHGEEDLITGHKKETLIKLKDNENLLDSKITYAISCKSAKKLGKEVVKKVALAYVGYEEDFILAYNKNKTATPLRDSLAKMFLEPSNELVLSLIKGNTVKEAHKRSQIMFKEQIQKLLTSESLPGSQNHVRYLFWNMIHQVSLGDIQSSF